MRRFLLLMTLASCTNPDEIFPVTGAVTSVDPVEGQVVRLLRRVQPFTPGDYGNCEPSAAVPFKETLADAEGKYGFDVLRVEADSLAGYDLYCFRIDATFPSGSTASSDFESIRFETPVGTLFDWRAAPRLENDVLSFEPPIPLPEEPSFVPTPENPVPPLITSLNHIAVVTTLDGGTVWQVEDRFFSVGGMAHREPMVLDSLRLEDFSSSITLRAGLAEPLSSGYGLASTINAPAVMLVAAEHLRVSGVRTPVSRGAPCPDLATPCPLTDGDLTAVDLPKVRDVHLTLRAASLSAMVFRGMELGRTNVGVEFSLSDGGTERFTAFIPDNSNSAFDPLAGASRRLPDGGVTDRSPVYVVVPLDAGAVEGVTLTFGEGLSRIQEISLFE